MTFDKRKYPHGEWMHGIFERASKEFIPIEELLPDVWYKGEHLAHSLPLDKWRFRVKLPGGVIFWSNFSDGQWSITQKNPKFVVTHWAKPIWIA